VEQVCQRGGRSRRAAERVPTAEIQPRYSRDTAEMEEQAGGGGIAGVLLVSAHERPFALPPDSLYPPPGLHAS